jgi:uncharacterized protein (TIGR02246 family)
MALTVLSTLLLAIGQPPGDAERRKTEDEVRQVEREWLDAYEKNDAGAMDRIVADDFTITFPNGLVQTKPDLMAGIRRPRKEGQPAPKFHTEDARARSYGDTVILIGKVVTVVERGGKTVREESRYTDTYIRREGRWQVVASHLSNAPVNRAKEPPKTARANGQTEHQFTEVVTASAKGTVQNALARLSSVWKNPPDTNSSGLSKDDDAVWKVRMESLVAIAKAGASAVPVLIDALKGGPPAQRILAAQALGMFADPSSKPAMQAALKDGQGQVRLYATRALSMFGRVERRPEYEAMRNGDGNWRVQAEMAAALLRNDKPDAAAMRKQLAEYDLKRMDSARLGAPAPDFTLVDTSSRSVRLEMFRGKKAVVLVFRIRDT